MPTSFMTKLTTARMRKKRRFRRMKMEGEDRMSELPDEILVSILSRLTLGEAVRTSVLSKRWRYVWTCIPALNFDAKEELFHYYRTSCRDEYKYSKWVSGVLAQHRGPNVDEFKVCFDLDKASSSHIDRWIEFALSNRVHSIDLSLYDFLTPSPRKCYRLHHRVLGMGLKNSSSNIFVGFKSLKTLSLKAVKVDDEAIEYFLSNCPLLERLSLHFIFALRNLKVVGRSHLLRHLEVVKCCKVKTIEICDTNLISFTYGGKKPKMMLLKNAPKLVEVSIDPDWSSIGRARAVFLMLSCCLSQLQILRLEIFHWKPEGLRKYMFPKLKNLKEIVLTVQRMCNYSLLGFLVMIKNWPNLQRFVLQIIYNGFHSHDKLRAPRANTREAARYCHPCLKVVEIAGFCNTCDFELFKQIIENVVVLEKIIIDTRNPNPDSDSDSDSESDSEYRELHSNEEQQLRTLVSPGVELVIL